MKVLFVILVVFGAASAVPLKAPKKNLQDLLTQQQNFNTFLQLIQQNPDLHQSLINTLLIDEYQLATEWLASQGFVLPRFGSIESHLHKYDLNNIVQQFLEDIGETSQQHIQTIIGTILFLAFEQSEELEIPMSIITSFQEDMLNAIEDMQNALEFTDDTSDLEYFIPVVILALEWMSAHPDDVHELVNFANKYIPVDEFISSVLYSFFSNFAIFIIPHLDSLGQQFVQEYLENFDLQDFQEFLSPDIVYEILIYCITNLDDAAVPISFLTSLGINYFQVVGQIFAGTFNPEQFLTPEIVAAAFNWTVAHPNDLPDLVSFFMDYLPLKQITSPLANILFNNIPSVLTSLVPSFSPELLSIFG